MAIPNLGIGVWREVKLKIYLKFVWTRGSEFENLL